MPLSRVQRSLRLLTSLQSRLMLGLAITWVVVALLLLGAAGLIGRSLISEVNFTHLRYESRVIAETVRCSVREVYVVCEGREFRVSLSVGVTAFRDSDHDTATLMARADAASYRAKAAGRDRVMVDSDC